MHQVETGPQALVMGRKQMLATAAQVLPMGHRQVWAVTAAAAAQQQRAAATVAAAQQQQALRAATPVAAAQQQQMLLHLVVTQPGRLETQFLVLIPQEVSGLRLAQGWMGLVLQSQICWWGLVLLLATKP
jgi:hypothetical protein